MKRPIFLGLICSGILLFAGCDRQCSRNVNDVTHLENRSGRKLNFSLCKEDRNKAQRLTLELDHKGKVDLGTGTEKYIRGGPAECELPEGGSRSVYVALSEESFKEVRLCYHGRPVYFSSEKSIRAVVVDLNQDCPLGSRAQISPDSKCVQ
jgi:hypothetical protein